MEREEFAYWLWCFAHALHAALDNMGHQVVNQAVAQAASGHQEHRVGEAGAPSRQALDERVADLEGRPR
jgi:hypothetical protein